MEIIIVNGKTITSTILHKTIDMRATESSVS